MIRIIKPCIVFGTLMGLLSCQATNPPVKSEGHINITEKAPDLIPSIIQSAPVLPKPSIQNSLETYTVIVNDVPVRELLFSMARDSNMNIDIDSDISGLVTLNAIDQSLVKILDRLTRQVNINYKIEDGTLHITIDKPYLHFYNINYLNMARLSDGSVTLSTQISSTGGSGGGGSDSSTSVTNKSINDFWKTLTENITKLISKPNASAALKANTKKNSRNIIVNRESGVLAVRATGRQHAIVTKFIDMVLGSAVRQVLIEATIAEVTLSDHYQSGIDWSVIGASGSTTSSIEQSVLGGNIGTTPFFSATLSNISNGNQLNVTLRALETFGDVKVLSSPKIMALNNQTSLLKVVDNQVYFSVSVTPATIDNGVVIPAVISTEIKTVPVGFVMSVTPFIDEYDSVTLNVRPTISRIISTVTDPNPALSDANVTSEVPIIQVREIESVLKVNNGDTAVIGGLMQDQINRQETSVPFLSDIPYIGNLFKFQDEEYVKSELVIFIRPVVIHDASLTGDLKDYRKYLLEDF